MAIQRAKLFTGELVAITLCRIYFIVLDIFWLGKLP